MKPRISEDSELEGSKLGGFTVCTYDIVVVYVNACLEFK